MTEQQLAAYVVAWLEAQHWDVYQEVQYGGVADIVAVRGPLVWVIECKTSFSLAVMDQASQWKAHLRSVAVPTVERGSSERSLALRICRNYLHLGVLEVDPRGGEIGRVQERVPAPLQRQHHEQAQRLRASLRPEHKTHAKAGTQGGGRYTPYRGTIEAVREFLAKAGPAGASIKDLYAALGKCHYVTEASMRGSLPGCLESFEKDWCEVVGEGKDRRYRLRTPS